LLVPEASRSLNPQSDRNLLFGILALQTDFIDRDALIGAMGAWVFDKAKPLGRILVEQGKLSADREALLDALVAEHLKANAGDPQRSLAALSSVSSARRHLSQVADPDVQASLASVGSAGLTDPDSTVDEPKPSGVRSRILRPSGSRAQSRLGNVLPAIRHLLASLFRPGVARAWHAVVCVVLGAVGAVIAGLPGVLVAFALSLLLLLAAAYLKQRQHKGTPCRA
jgi:hypothetical protein